MKKLTTLLLSMAIVGQAMAQNPVITNADFEGPFRNVNSSVSFPPVSINSVAPEGWFCADSLIVTLAPQLSLAGFTSVPYQEQCFRDTVTFPNSVAVGLSTYNLNDTLQIPGVLSNASVSVDFLQLMQTQDILGALKYTGGTPGNGMKVDEVSVKAFLDTMYKEDARINVIAMAKNPLNNDSFEVIGNGSVTISVDTAIQNITIPVDYINPQMTATDTFVIVAMSSESPFAVAGNPKNYLVIDDFTATYSAGSIPTISIENLYTATDINMYPVPTQGILNIDFAKFNTNKNYAIQILGLDGKVLKTETLRNAKSTIDVSALTAGLYIVTLTENNTKVYHQSVSVQ